MYLTNLDPWFWKWLYYLCIYQNIYNGCIICRWFQKKIQLIIWSAKFLLEDFHLDILPGEKLLCQNKEIRTHGKEVSIIFLILWSCILEISVQIPWNLRSKIRKLHNKFWLSYTVNHNIQWPLYLVCYTIEVTFDSHIE